METRIMTRGKSAMERGGGGWGALLGFPQSVVERKESVNQKDIRLMEHELVE